MTKEELAAAVKSEQMERVQACATAIAEILEKHGCELGAVVKVSADGRLAGEVQLLAK